MDHKGNCVPSAGPQTCKDGQVWDDKLYKCVPKPPEQKCPEGQDKGKDGKCVPKPPEQKCPDGKEKDKYGKCPGGSNGSGGNTGGSNTGNNNNSSSNISNVLNNYNSSSSSNVINSYGSSYYDGVFDRGGVFVSNILPYHFTGGVEDAGYYLKSNLPTPVAETLPETGGGWVTLAVAAGALFLTGRFLIRRFSK